MIQTVRGTECTVRIEDGGLCFILLSCFIFLSFLFSILNLGLGVNGTSHGMTWCHTSVTITCHCHGHIVIRNIVESPRTR